MRVHSTLMCTLTTTTELRSRNASPNGSPVLYEIPRRIRPKLEALLDFTSEWLKRCESTWEALKCGTLFFSEFLLIHPFRDGNGRTARLLLSHLLRFHTWVPISLYLYRGKDKNREIYINVLEERVNQSSPDALFFYLVDCYRSTITTAKWALQ
jgi:Fic family protein